MVQLSQFFIIYVIVFCYFDEKFLIICFLICTTFGNTALDVYIFKLYLYVLRYFRAIFSSHESVFDSEYREREHGAVRTANVSMTHGRCGGVQRA